MKQMSKQEPWAYDSGGCMVDGLSSGLKKNQKDPCYFLLFQKEFCFLILKASESKKNFDKTQSLLR